MHLENIDLIVVAVYAVFLFGLAQWVSREEKGHAKNTQDYFLAGRALPWWAIGTSLIAANISAEQIIGMSGSAYVMGIAIASYEWMAAITLLLVGKYLLPVFLKHQIYTMPQFLEQRFDGRVRTVMGTYWLGLYVVVNLTSILWLGALAIHTVTGLEITTALILLAMFATAYSLYGGLKAVALTDVIQVVLLVFGGLMIAYVSMNVIGGNGGVIVGFKNVMTSMPEKFHMIFSPDSPHYKHLPGLSVLLGGMWVMNLSYWGFNQYIIQRALAAKNSREAQKGIAFAAFLKMLMPIIVVLPGIAAAMLAPDLSAPDKAYPEVMKLLPAGLTGLVFAALIAAIVSSLASMMNSIATIFTMDMYARLSKSQHTEQQLVRVGRIVSFSAMLIAAILAQPLLGQFDQAFQFIQDFTGFFTPGICAIFLLAIFWKRTTANGVLAVALASVLLSLGFYLAWSTLPFIDRVGIVFVACVLIGIVVSISERREPAPNAIDYGSVDTTTSAGFNIAAALVCMMLVAIYTVWW